MPVLAWFISLTLSRHGVIQSQHEVWHHVNWVNAEWDSTSTESTQKTPTFTKFDSVDVESHSALTQLTRNETPRQQSHRRMLKNLNKSANSRTKLKNSKALLFSLYVFDKCKNENKKILCKCTFKRSYTKNKSSSSQNIKKYVEYFCKKVRVAGLYIPVDSSGTNTFVGTHNILRKWWHSTVWRRQFAFLCRISFTSTVLYLTFGISSEGSSERQLVPLL
jgi:hypothetical protein